MLQVILVSDQIAKNVSKIKYEFDIWASQSEVLPWKDSIVNLDLMAPQSSILVLEKITNEKTSDVMWYLSVFSDVDYFPMDDFDWLISVLN